MSSMRAFIEERDGVRFCDADPLDPDAQTDVVCASCGASAEWIDCENCTDGFTGHDCGEDTCCCVDPQDNLECDQCDGVEGYWRCTARVHHGGETMLVDGSPVTPAHREIDPTTGMQRGYVVLSATERAKGFVRPVRRSYRHLSCGTVTTMTPAIAETYARDPKFYGGTFCAGCRQHFPVGESGEFVWEGTSDKVGT